MIELIDAQVADAQISADRSSVAISGSVVNSQVIIGITQEKVDSLVKGATESLTQRTEEQRALIKLLTERLNVNESQISAALKILGEANVPPERLPSKLIDIAQQFKIMREAAAAEPGDSATIANLKNEAKRKIEAGELVAADESLARLVDEQRRARDLASGNIAVTQAQRGDIALTRLQYARAATFFEAAAELVRSSTALQDKYGTFIEKEADALYRQGEELGEDKSLRRSVELRRNLLSTLVGVERAKVAHHLGIALSLLGERHGGAEAIVLLEEGIRFYQESLTIQERPPRSTDWAATQSNLGNALLELGTRKNSKSMIDSAMKAFQAALEARSGSRSLEWAISQQNLGNALIAYHQIAPGSSRLDEAVKIYKEAIGAVEKDEAPMIWQAIQNNIGIASHELWRKERRKEWLLDAGAAFREALTVIERSRFRIDWSIAQYNLANTLLDLSDVEKDDETLTQAIGAYRAALEELTQERAGLYWVQAQNNLGNALVRYGTRRSDIQALRSAANAYQATMNEWTRDKSPRNWARNQSRVGDVLITIGRKQNDTLKIAEALKAYQSVSEMKDRRLDPVGWGRAKQSVCLSGWLLAYRLGDKSKMSRASKDCEEASAEVQSFIGRTTQYPPEYVSDAGQMLGGMAYTLILTRNYTKALIVADVTIRRFPEIGWVRLNRAHALMLLGRSKDAQNEYMSSIKAGMTAEEWSKALTNDFAEMREYGLANPIMEKIEKSLSQSR